MKGEIGLGNVAKAYVSREKRRAEGKRYFQPSLVIIISVFFGIDFERNDKSFAVWST